MLGPDSRTYKLVDFGPFANIRAHGRQRFVRRPRAKSLNTQRAHRARMGGRRQVTFCSSSASGRPSRQRPGQRRQRHRRDAEESSQPNSHRPEPEGDRPERLPREEGETVSDTALPRNCWDSSVARVWIALWIM